jgi:hypothetical protein
VSTKKSRFEGLFTPQDTRPAQPGDAPRGEEARKQESKKARIQETKKSRKEESPVLRIKTNYEIRQEYLRALKRIAVEEERKIYEVLEEAIGEYLERHQKRDADTEPSAALKDHEK